MTAWTTRCTSDGMIIAVRSRRDDSLSQPRESLPNTDPELRRYRAAGASAAARYSFPGGRMAEVVL